MLVTTVTKAPTVLHTLCAIAASTVACSDHRAGPPDGGALADAAAESTPDANAGPGDGAAPNDGTAPVEFISARFGNFDTNLPPFDICVRTQPSAAGSSVITAPLLAATAGLADGVPLDRVTARVAIPFLPRSRGIAEMFLVRGDTTDCAAPTEALRTDLAFGFFAGASGERNSFVAVDSGLMTLVRERETCPTSTACLHFFNFSTRMDGTGVGPDLTVDLVEGGTRMTILRDISTGNDGPAEPPFVFDSNTGTVEIPVSGAGPLTLAVGESAATAPFMQIELPDPSGQLFSLWMVGHPGVTGPFARRAILCRDFAPDVDSLAACTRLEPL